MSLAVLQASVLQTNGALSVAAGAQITVRTPAGALATLYEDRAGTTPTGANPIFADSKGFFRVYVAPGRYDVTVTTSSGTQVYKDIALFADGATIGHATGNLIPAGGANGALTFGTNDAQPVATKTNNIERSRITSTGNHLIGTTTDNGVDKVQVNGSVSATAVRAPYLRAKGAGGIFSYVVNQETIMSVWSNIAVGDIVLDVFELKALLPGGAGNIRGIVTGSVIYAANDWAASMSKLDFTITVAGGVITVANFTQSNVVGFNMGLTYEVVDTSVFIRSRKQSGGGTARPSMHGNIAMTNFELLTTPTPR